MPAMHAIAMQQSNELAQQLLAKRPTLKVIYTSGYSAEVFRGDFVLPTGVDFLRKPYRAEELLAASAHSADPDQLPAQLADLLLGRVRGPAPRRPRRRPLRSRRRHSPDSSLP